MNKNFIVEPKRKPQTILEENFHRVLTNVMSEYSSINADWTTVLHTSKSLCTSMEMAPMRPSLKVLEYKENGHNCIMIQWQGSDCISITQITEGDSK